MKRSRALHGVLLAGLAWRVYLAWPVTHVSSTLVALALGLAPYAAVLGFSSAIRARVVLTAAAIVALLLDVTVGVAVMRSSSSTAGVALLLEPLGVALVLSVTLSGLVLRRHRLRRSGVA